MSSFAFLATIVREILSGLRLSSEKEDMVVTGMDRWKLVLRRAMIGAITLTMLVMTYRYLTLSQEFRDYKKSVAQELVECQTKIDKDDPSDSGTGLGISGYNKPAKPAFTREICLASNCPINKDVINEYAN